jgi:hypothetical protein
MVDEALAVSGAGQKTVAEAGSLMQLHITPSRTLWRIGPAWAVLAGAVAAGVPLGNADALLRLAAAVILADLIWGILRRIIPDSSGNMGTVPTAAPSLPYGHGDAPLARLLQNFADGQPASTAPWLGWLSGLVLTVVLSLLLGGPALVASVSVVGLIFLARALLRSGHTPALCLALLDVALPWVLGAALAWSGVNSDRGDWLWHTALLALAFTALQWGFYRVRCSAGQRTMGLWAGQLTVLGALMALRQPWALAAAAVLLAPPAWWLAQRERPDATLIHSLPWWWALMLSVAVIVR